MMTTNILTGEDSRSRWGWAILVLLGAMAIAAIILSPQTGWVAVGLCGAVVLLSLASDLFRGRIDRMLVGWAALFPLGMFCAFPREHAFVTLEREMLVLAAIALLFAKPSEFTSVPKPFRRVGVACLAFIAVSALSLGKSPDFLYAARQLIDLYVVPLLFAWGVVAWFDVRRYLPALHIAVCISAMISASVAAAEVVTGQDYLPAGGSVLYFAGDVARANGPFASDDQLALIGGVTLFFLILLRAALGDQLSTGRKFLHSVGLAAAVGMTVMPLFRSAMTTLVIVLVIDTFWERKASRRVWRIALIVAFAAAIVAASILLPGLLKIAAEPKMVLPGLLSISRTTWFFGTTRCWARDFPTSTILWRGSLSTLPPITAQRPRIGPTAISPRPWQRRAFSDSCRMS